MVWYPQKKYETPNNPSRPYARIEFDVGWAGMGTGPDGGPAPTIGPMSSGAYFVGWGGYQLERCYFVEDEDGDLRTDPAASCTTSSGTLLLLDPPLPSQNEFGCSEEFTTADVISCTLTVWQENLNLTGPSERGFHVGGSATASAQASKGTG